MKKKIFFTDLDETLLTREKNMTPATVDVITKLTEKGQDRKSTRLNSSH